MAHHNTNAIGLATQVGVTATKVAANVLADEISKMKKKTICIEIENQTKVNLFEAKVYLKHGEADKIVPRIIGAGSSGTYEVAITSGKINGVLMYKFEKHAETMENDEYIAIYFKVPLDNHLTGKNKWGIQTYNSEEIERFGFREGVRDNRFLLKVRKALKKISRAADNSHYILENRNGFDLHICMLTSAKCKLAIKITDEHKSERTCKEDYVFF